MPPRRRKAAAAAVTVPDVVAMTQAHVAEGIIVDRIRTRGIAAQLQTNDVIYLHQQGVSDNVIGAMESQPVATAGRLRTTTMRLRRNAVYVGGGYYGPRYYYPGPRVGIGFGWR